MEANAKANALLTDSQTKNETLVAEKEGLDQEMGAFKAKIEGLLRAQLDMVQTDEWNAFQTPAAYQEPSAAAVSEESVPEEVSQDTETVVIFPEDAKASENFLNKDK